MFWTLNKALLIELIRDFPWLHKWFASVWGRSCDWVTWALCTVRARFVIFGDDLLWYHGWRHIVSMWMHDRFQYNDVVLLFSGCFCIILSSYFEEALYKQCILTSSWRIWSLLDLLQSHELPSAIRKSRLVTFSDSPETWLDILVVLRKYFSRVIASACENEWKYEAAFLHNFDDLYLASLSLAIF